MAHYSIGQCSFCDARMVYQANAHHRPPQLVCRECMPPDMRDDLEQDFKKLPKRLNEQIPSTISPTARNLQTQELLTHEVHQTSEHLKTLARQVAQNELTFDEALIQGVRAYMAGLMALGITSTIEDCIATVATVLEHAQPPPAP